MTDAPKGFGDAMASLGAALTSPAKLAFAGYVILAYKGAVASVSLSQFLIIATVFLVVNILHDDFCRILLNRWAYGIAEKRHWPSQ